jgi:hypothetical protein
VRQELALVNAPYPRRAKFERQHGRVLKICGLLNPHHRNPGGIMTTQSIQNLSYPSSERSERIKDLLLVSSFGLWAVLLGLMPVLAFRLLLCS